MRRRRSRRIRRALRLFSARAYGIALRVVRDPALAEDVAHDAWLNVWDCAAAFD
ncbi:sigma factor, partial [Corynebacterium sanguinis]